MARIKITLPDRFVFSTEIPVMVRDINAGRHLSYDSLLPMMEETRVRFMRSINYSQENVNGASIIAADVAVVYKQQGRYGQVLKFELAPTDFSKKGCDFVFRISDSATGEEVARAKMGIVFFDYAKQKSVSVPEAFRKKFDS
jgi:acyl-CoA thioester hydrolase